MHSERQKAMGLQSWYETPCTKVKIQQGVRWPEGVGIIKKNKLKKTIFEAFQQQHGQFLNSHRVRGGCSAGQATEICRNPAKINAASALPARGCSDTAALGPRRKHTLTSQPYPSPRADATNEDTSITAPRTIGSRMAKITQPAS